MAKRGSDDIDGFAYVQAMKRASARSAIKPKVHDTADKELLLDSGVKTSSASQNRVAPMRTGGKVAVPTKRLVICYSCGYSHTLSGRMHHSFCPKCRTKLITEDLVVSGQLTEDILTIGDVTITADAVFDPGLRVTGRRVVLGGDVTPLASITAMGNIEICSNAQFAGVELINPSGQVVVPSGEVVSLEAAFVCGVLHVYGYLRASVTVNQSACVFAGGLLEGAFRGPSLVVEDGAGLVGEVALTPLGGE